METKALQCNPQHSTCLKTRGVQKPNWPIKPSHLTQLKSICSISTWHLVEFGFWDENTTKSVQMSVFIHLNDPTQRIQTLSIHMALCDWLHRFPLPFIGTHPLSSPFLSNSLPQSIRLPRYLSLIASASTKEKFDLETIRMACPRWRSIWKGIY